ncbi:MAG: HAMP domain-containing histidine kinase [Candidatus Aminicenantes bacterium]|nr:MAG: HAMP domain-containing histidine kinase [Candidatus Aminicenantes bacterium]
MSEATGPRSQTQVAPGSATRYRGGSEKDRFSYIFSWELHERLLWFCKLRWLAAAGLALASVLGPYFSMPSTRPSLAVVAVLVAIYNGVFIHVLRARLGPEKDYAALRGLAILQMVTDLAALLFTVHFTGGCASPVLPFVVFHMAIGTIMIDTRAMYALAFATSATAGGLFVLEHLGVLAHYPTLAGGQSLVGGCVLSTFMLIVLVFGVVYLTDSVTSRFKARNIELHRTTTELRRALDEQEQLERRKSHYMRISAHQLRSPLGTIKTSIQVLIDGYLDPGSPEGHRLLEGTASRVDSLLAIVNDLLELAKMREGRARAPWARKVSINQILADIFDAVDPIARDASVELVPHFINEGAAVLDWAVPPDLVYAFENLIHNAIKYSKPEGGTVTVALGLDRSHAMVVVADEGIGIPADLQDDVFLEFVRAPNAKHAAAEGTGLGLSIVREAVQMHGGKVSLESAEGVGTTVTVVLPLHHIPPEITRG